MIICNGENDPDAAVLSPPCPACDVGQRGESITVIGARVKVLTLLVLGQQRPSISWQNRVGYVGPACGQTVLGWRGRRCAQARRGCISKWGRVGLGEIEIHAATATPNLRGLRLDIEVRPRLATPPRPVNGAWPEANIVRGVCPRRAGRRLAINRQAT